MFASAQALSGENRDLKAEVDKSLAACRRHDQVSRSWQRSAETVTPHRS
jgi:hypothetical protein